MEPGELSPGGTPATRHAPWAGADDLPDRLFPPLAHGVHWGLERTLAALRELGDPHLGYRTLHVGGTNGKGSVASGLAAVLRAGGAAGNVGLYTSPHLVHFEERYHLNGEPAGEEALLDAARDVRPALEAHGLSYFEAATVLAFHLFARMKVDTAVVEVGLGGRLDATNVIRPLVCGVTNVGLDHADYLGDTPEEIAEEKAGIAKEGVPFLTAESDPGLVEVLRRGAEKRNAPFFVLDPRRGPSSVEVSRDGTSFEVESTRWGRLRLWSPLPGAHQAVNGTLVVRMAEILPEELVPDRDAVVRGLAEVRLPGRLQILERSGVTFVFDVAHNTAGVLALVRSLDALRPPEPVVMLVGILGDKDWQAMLPPLFAGAREAILSQPLSAPPERRWNPEEAARVVAPTIPVRVVPDLRQALKRARAAAVGGTVVVTGSHRTVGDAMAILGIEGSGGSGASPGSPSVAPPEGDSLG